MPQEQFTLEQIKAAFWAQFHGAGELWFPYERMGADAEECKEATQRAFDEFLQHLGIMAVEDAR